MSASQNGWRVLTRDQCADLAVAGGVLPVHPMWAPIFLDLVTQYAATVEPLEWPGCWGWADRPIAGSDETSNHASGTAVDLCAPKHPQGVATSRTFTRAQITACLKLEQRYGGLIVWGGTWALPDTDGMHWEGAEGSTPEQVTALAAKLAGSPTPAPAPRPSPAPPGPTWTGPDLVGVGAALRGDQGDNGPRVAAWQAWLNRYAPAYSRLAVDGVWGPATTAVNREFGHRSGIPSADGTNIGPKLAAAYWRAGLFRTSSATRSRLLGHARPGAGR